MQIQLIARHVVAPGNEEPARALVEQLVAAARSEPGNIAFEAFYSAENPRAYVLLERYASSEALEEHRATTHFKDIVLTRLLPLLENRDLEEYEVHS